MIYSTLTSTAMTASKLQMPLNNIQSQLKLEKASSLAKDNKIKSLEDLVIKIGYDPSNVKAVEEIVKKKNVDIATLRKQLKMPATEVPQAKEVGETESQKENMLRLIMEKNAQIRDMEVEMDKLIKEKEHSAKLAIIPLDAIPLATIVK